MDDSTNLSLTTQSDDALVVANPVTGMALQGMVRESLVMAKAALATEAGTVPDGFFDPSHLLKSAKYLEALSLFFDAAEKSGGRSKTNRKVSDRVVRFLSCGIRSPAVILHGGIAQFYHKRVRSVPAEKVRAYLWSRLSHPDESGDTVISDLKLSEAEVRAGEELYREILADVRTSNREIPLFNGRTYLRALAVFFNSCERPRFNETALDEKERAFGRDCYWLIREHQLFAHYLMGSYFFDERFTPQNRILAYLWFSLAADQGLRWSKLENLRSQMSPEELREGEMLHADIRTEGHKTGMENVAPKGQKYSEELAFFLRTCGLLGGDNWYDKMIKEGWPPLAFFEIGRRFFAGDGVTEDKARAYLWLTLAADLGYRRDLCWALPHQMMLPAEREAGKALYREGTSGKLATPSP
ncbi:MAG: hypothetical protein WC378_16545 [Opitutaceae bacterium]|jgi:hypothetical protein